MNVNSLDEASTLFVEKVLNGRNQEIVFLSLSSGFSITDIYNDAVRKNPRLLLCIESLSGAITGWIGGYQYTINVKYTDVYPDFVSIAEDEVQVKKVLLKSATAHRKKEYFVCKSSYVDMVLATVRSIVSYPEYLNCYISGVQSSILKRNEANYVGIIVLLSYSCDYRTAQRRKLELDRITESIAAGARAHGPEDWKKAYAVMLYCVKNWKYSFDDGSGRAFTAYGAIVENKAVCMGFSLALCTIFKKLGIPCKYICGQRNGEGHAWNMVYIKGGWFYIDITDAIGARDPLYHWGITTFDDGRVIGTNHGQKLACYCDRQFVLKHFK